MKLKKDKSSPQIEHAVGKAVNYEVTVADIARRSERRAWMVAFAAIGMSLILAGGYFYMLPLKEKVPYLIMADAYTGNATVARLQGDINNDRITSSEAINKANIAAFIRARESYDSTLIWERDWKTFFAMAEPQVDSSYRALYSPRNPASPSKVYGKTQAIRVKILSIQLGPPGKNGPRSATVRFQRSLVDKNSGGSRLLDNRIATLEYTYKSNLAMNEDTRMINPLGFRVSAYRVDNDYSTMPAPPNDDAMAAPTVVQVPGGTEMPVGPEEMPSMELPPGAMPAAGVAAPGYPNAPAAAPTQGNPAPAGAVPNGAYPTAPAGTAYPAPNTGAPANAAYPPAAAANQANGVRTR